MTRTVLATFALLAALPSPARAIEATYDITFENLWNPTDHPRNYPGTAHFTSLVGAAHSGDVSFWSAGVLATRGVEFVAELGSTSAFFRGDVGPAVAAGDALQNINLPGNIFLGESNSGGSFTVTDEFPLVTLLSMVAPSPDWFIGIHDVDLREGGSFVAERVFEFTSFYDAGTEEGSAFTLTNPDTVPAEPIAEVAGPAAAQLFVGPAATSLPPIARITLTRTSLTVPEPAAAVLVTSGAALLLATRRRL